MKYIFIITIILFSACNKPQKPAESTDITDNNTDAINIGYSDDGATLYPFEVEKISEADYLKYDTAYTKLIKKEIRETDSLFYIEIAGQENPFKKETNFDYGNRGGESWYEYIGYFPELDLYALLSVYVSGDLHGFSDFILIDSLTGCKYSISPIGDGFEEIPILSPNNKYMVHYYNDIYSAKTGSNIEIIKLKDKKTCEDYITGHLSPDTFGFFIDKITWIADNELLIKAYQEENDMSKTYEYYKAKFGE